MTDWEKAVFATGQAHPFYNCPSRHATPSKGNHDKGGNTRFIDWSLSPPSRQTIPGSTNIMRGGIDYAGSCQDTLTWDLQRNNVTTRIVSGSNIGHGPMVRTNGLSPSGNPGRTVIGFEGITDGTSNVIWVTEKRLPPNEWNIGPWNHDTGYITGWDGDTLISAFDNNNASLQWPPIPDTAKQANGQFVPNICCQGSRAGSSHPAGIQAVMCDGSVRLINYNIDFPTYAFLLYRGDGQVTQQN
jgi:hypothetical protein